MCNKLFSFPVLLLLFSVACKKTERNNTIPSGSVSINTRVVTQNLSNPWEIIWGNDGMIWMTERGGRISKVNPATGAVTPLLTISEVKAQGEGGLLGMALHPDFFGSTPHLFVAYNYDKNGNYTEKVVRYTYNGTAWKFNCCSKFAAPFTVLTRFGMRSERR